jgi:hypothetical protein
MAIYYSNNTNKENLNSDPQFNKFKQKIFTTAKIPINKYILDIINHFMTIIVI